MNDWENSKENVKPVKSGRSAKGLSMASIGGDALKLRDQTIKEEQAFEELISSVSDQVDPLETYVRYFKWIRSTFPSDLNKSLSLLERCTCALSRNTMYRNDIRFVKLWIEYADAVRTPGEIFSYMQSNKIGVKLSLFWIAWAFVTEKLENFKLTDQIFQKGISKQAEPKDLLQKRYQQFQRRMARHYLNLTAESEGGRTEGDTQGKGSERGALSSLSKSQAARPQRANGHPQRPRGLKINDGGATSSSSDSAVPGKKNAGGFSIFDENSAPQTSTAPDNIGEINENSMWTAVPTESARHKENQGVPTFWNDAPLVPSSTSTSSPSRQRQAACPIAFFIDEDTKELPEDSQKDSVAPTSRRVLNEYSGKTTIDQLSKNPLRRHKETAVMKKKSTASVKTQNLNEIGDTLDVAHEAAEAACAASSSSSKATGTKVSQTGSGCESDENTNLSKLLSGLGDNDREDVTINTKLAMKDIDSMFCSPPGNASMTSLGFSICEDITGRHDLSAAVNELSDIQEGSRDGRTSVFALGTP